MSNPTHNTPTLPALPKSWSELTWQQLTECWQAKMRYGGNADVARAAALLALLGLKVCRDNRSNRNNQSNQTDPLTGEAIYTLCSTDGHLWVCTPRSLAHIAKKALPWFDYPYGDPGAPAEKDEKGKVVKEAREPVRGCVNAVWRDAMALPVEELKVGGRCFALPQVAMNNLTWEQYRSLQALAPQLFREGITEGEAMSLQAQFLAYCLVPRSLALLDTSGGSIRLRPHWEFRYNAGQAEGLARWWEKRMKQTLLNTRRTRSNRTDPTALFHVCFQCYQTALQYYSQAYPLLFQDSGKSDPLRDALTGEVGTINTVMKYAGYSDQQQVYDSNLPFVLDILNTMTKEAKEIEKMNSKIKKK